MKLKFSGVIPPMLTPLTAHRDVDRDGIHRLAGHLLENGVSGIFVLGTSGEGPWLTLEQSRVIVQESVAAVDGQIPVLAGVLQPGTRQALETVEVVYKAGADAIVVTTPYYYECDEATLRHHFQTIIEQSPLPVVFYNIPSKTHHPLTNNVVQEFISEPKVIGLKNSSENFEDFTQFMQLKEIRPDFSVMQGAERLSVPALRTGADGLVSGLSNLVPDIFRRMLEYARQGQFDQAQTLQNRVEKLWFLHTYGHWLVCLKYAASLLHLCPPHTLAFHDELPPASRRAIEALVQEI
ncbi:MAG TPA: dihydrodipicolinate synthase family protein [Aggregatilineales bacterium]|nr:dihydrodipicolinate synthase family protein [Aggregatilineales bacterium]